MALGPAFEVSGEARVATAFQNSSSEQCVHLPRLRTRTVSTLKPGTICFLKGPLVSWVYVPPGLCYVGVDVAFTESPGARAPGVASESLVGETSPWSHLPEGQNQARLTRHPNPQLLKDSGASGLRMPRGHVWG